MKAKITFNEDGYIKQFVTDWVNGNYEVGDDFDFDFLHCYHLVDDELVLDEDKKAEQIADEQKAEEIASLQAKLNDSDYIIARTFEEIMALDNSLTFIADFIKILKDFRSKYADVLANRKTWRARIEELRK